MKTIVVPTDFSSVSKNAALYGAELAANIHASLALLHVCQLPVVYSEVPVPVPGPGESTEEAEAKIMELKNHLLEKTGNQVKIYTDVRVGSIISELKSYCEKINPYAVVMGSHGAGAWERFLFGSNTLWSMKHLSWPLMVVPANAKFKTIKTIGLACDFKRVIDTAPVKEIRKIVEDLKADLHVLYINTEQKEEVYDAAIIEESSQLQEMLGDLNPHYHFIDHPDIDDGISEYAIKYGLDLLVVVPKKHDILDRLFHKSHTKQLAIHTQMPLMAVHE